MIKEGDLLMVAHHEDDQAETVLLQLLRGAGLEGIAGMPEHAPLGSGYLLRPLLRVEQRQIWAYAENKGLAWIEDPTNRGSRFDRNYLRQTVMPALKQRWPAASRALSRTARHAAQAAEAQRTQQSILSARLAPAGHFDLKSAGTLDDPELRLAIRGWFSCLNLRMPSERMIESFIQAFLKSGSDRNPILPLSDGSQLRRYRNYAYRVSLQGSALPIYWIQWRKALNLPEMNGFLEMTPSAHEDEKNVIWNERQIEIRYRRGGEQIKLSERGGHHDLRDLFQERGIPPWVRDRIPLIYLGETLVCVGDFWVNAEAFDEGKWASSPKPVWTPPPNLDPSGALEALQLSGRLSP